jgi:hypothetical protein
MVSLPEGTILATSSEAPKLVPPALQLSSSPWKRAQLGAGPTWPGSQAKRPSVSW